MLPRPLLSLFSIFSSLVVLSSFSTAAILQYDEVVSGDLTHSFASPPAIGTFDLGINTVSGRWNSEPVDFDSFAFSIAPGQQLNSVSMVTTGSGGTGWALYHSTESNVFNYLSSTGFLANPISTPMFANATPLGAGSYKVWQGALSGQAAYTFSFDVGPATGAVPEPTMFAIWGTLGAVGVIASRRRQRAA